MVTSRNVAQKISKSGILKHTVFGLVTILVCKTATLPELTKTVSQPSHSCGRPFCGHGRNVAQICQGQWQKGHSHPYVPKVSRRGKMCGELWTTHKYCCQIRLQYCGNGHTGTWNVVAVRVDLFAARLRARYMHNSCVSCGCSPERPAGADKHTRGEPSNRQQQHTGAISPTSI